MKSIKGTETEKNLMAAFAGESQARNRYTMFSSIAKKEGYVQIADIFEETANQEKEHAKRFFRFLEGGMCEITASFPAGKEEDTVTNLKNAAAGEMKNGQTFIRLLQKKQEKKDLKQLQKLLKQSVFQKNSMKKDTKTL